MKKYLIALCIAVATITNADTSPEVVLSFTTGKRKNITKTKYKRKGIATFYDSKNEKLINASPNHPRYEVYPNNPAGQNRGILLESAAANFALNSSFERDLKSTWQADGKLKTKKTDKAIHGNNAINLTGSGTLLQTVKAASPFPKSLYGCISGYFCGDEKSLSRIRPVIYAIENGKRGGNLVKKFRWVKYPGCKWRRLAAVFKAPAENLTYVAGFSFKDADNVLMDAVQAEIANCPWRVSSYIPTGDAPETRGKDYFQVYTKDFSIKKGSLLIWYKCNNPFGRTGNMFVHGPVKNRERLYLCPDSVTIGKTRIKAVKRPYTDKTPEQDWRLYTVTWQDGKAGLYHNGKENSVKEGEFAYASGRLRNYAGYFILHEPCPIYMGPEGLISFVSLIPDKLTPEQIKEIYGVSSHGKESKFKGLPISYDVAKSGRISLGIYDNSGVLKRQLVLGKKVSPGHYKAWWDGCDDAGELLPPGRYLAKWIENNLRDKWIVSVGNTGNPPWGKSKVRGGFFRSVAVAGNRIIAANPIAEGNCQIQAFDPDSGQVIWTSEIDPIYGDLCAITADKNYVYVVGVYRSEKNAMSRQIFREALWRLSLKNGKLVPWAPGKSVLPLNSSRTAPKGRRFTRRYFVKGKDYNDPYYYLEVNDIEVADGKLYVPFRRENLIRIYDAQSGKLIDTLKNIPSPKCLAVSGKNLYVVSGRQILKYSLQGREEGRFVTGLEAPYEVEVDNSGQVLVSEFGSAQLIKIFSPNGELVKTFGKRRGSSLEIDGDPENFFFPASIAVLPDNRLAVADQGNGRVVILRPDGRFVKTIFAHGLGGIDGGVSFIPGRPETLYSANLNIRLPWTSFNIVRYAVDWKKGSWKVDRRWSDFSPVYVKDPIFARTLPNGRTYLFCLCGFPSIFEIKSDNKLVFCLALFHPQKWGRNGLLDGYLSKPVYDDAKRLGLLNSKGHFKNLMLWTDTNRDTRIQRDEIQEFPQQLKRFYSVNDADVTSNGDMFLGDYYSSSLWRFARQGFDQAGNPIYDLAKVKKIWDIASYPKLGGKGWGIYGKEVDDNGNIYLSQLKNAACYPDDVRLLKLDSAGRLRWITGRKSRGFKDKPGEFASVTCLPHVQDGILYILEYEGTLDIYTTDGLYLATLLEAGNQGKPGPRANWGENFSGDVVKDRNSGKVYFVINTHNYVLPGFEIVGYETIRRGQQPLELTQIARDRLKNSGQNSSTFDNVTAIYSAPTVTLDGKLSEWQTIPARKAVVPDKEQTYYAHYKMAADAKNLYLAFQVSDPTPAVNTGPNIKSLWCGDALEMYFSANPPHADWRKNDYILHVAVTENLNRPRISLYDRVTGKWQIPKGVESAVQIWPDEKGYNLEIKIPLALLGLDNLKPGQRILFDWDIVYNNPSGEAGFKLYRSPFATNAIVKEPMCWGQARKVENSGTENAVYVYPFSGSWNKVFPQAELEIPDTGNAYKAELKTAYTKDGLRFHLHVKDPDPALCTPSGQWVGTGDFTEFFLNNINIYVVASPAFTQPFIRKGAELTPIDKGTSHVKVKASSYIMEIFLPWKAVGGKKTTYDFNWKMAWSDKTGGSAFGRRELCSPTKKSTLKIIEN